MPESLPNYTTSNEFHSQCHEKYLKLVRFFIHFLQDYQPDVLNILKRIRASFYLDFIVIFDMWFDGFKCNVRCHTFIHRWNCVFGFVCNRSMHAFRMWRFISICHFTMASKVLFKCLLRTCGSDLLVQYSRYQNDGIFYCKTLPLCTIPKVTFRRRNNPNKMNFFSQHFKSIFQDVMCVCRFHFWVSLIVFHLL